MILFRRLMLVCCLGATLVGGPGWTAEGEPERYALVVGVSDYEAFDERLDLVGPGNDAVLVSEFLVRHGFAADNIRVLSDASDTAERPTKAAIMGALDQLASTVEQGDFVYLHFGGHGSQQPVVAERGASASSEFDGLDEIFLPIDVGTWDGGKGAVDNAIVDDEIQTALARIRERGAFIWVVFDSCHSGTMTRGVELDAVRERKVSPQALGIPDPVLASVAAQRSRGTAAPEAGMIDSTDTDSPSEQGGMVAFYAAQTRETTPEMRLPSGDPKRQSHGLFSFTLVQVVSNNPGITYRQAAAQILHEYAARGWQRTTPLFEGGDALDAPVFGTRGDGGDQRWLVRTQGQVTSLSAGKMHDLDAGAVVALYPTPVASEDERLGYAEIASADLWTSVVTPVKYGDMPALERLPERSYAVLVSSPVKLGLRVARPTLDALEKAERKRLTDLLSQLETAGKDSLQIRWVPAGDDADIRLAVAPHDDQQRFWLLPATGEIVTEGPGRTHSASLALDDAALGAWLNDSLLRIAKVSNLLRLGAHMGTARSAASIDIAWTVRRKGSRDEEVISAGQIPTLSPGDYLSYTIHNAGSKPVDVTILFVDSDYGITAVFPYPGESNRLEPGADFTSGGDITEASLGLEHMMVLAVAAETTAPETQFTFLEQPALPQVASARGGESLTGLLTEAGFGAPASRGFSRPASATLSQGAMETFSWRTR